MMIRPEKEDINEANKQKSNALTSKICSHTSYSWMTLGWRTFLRILISLVILSTSF